MRKSKVSVLGFCIIAAFGIVELGRNFSSPQKGKSKKLSIKYIPFLISLLILIPFSIKTYSRNKDWKNSFTLFKADIVNSPKSARLKYFYGNELRVKKANVASSQQEKIHFLNESIDQYNKALEIYPEYKAVIGALGISYYRLGDKQQAYKYYDRAIKMGTTDAITYNNIT